MKLLTIAFLLVSATVSNAQQTLERLPVGLWHGVSQSGHQVTLSLSANLCRMEVTWSAGHIGGFCIQQKNGRMLQVVLDQRNASVYSTPEYRPNVNEAPQVAGVATMPNLGLFLERSGSSWNGHIVGVGGNTHVTLRKHQ